MFENGFWYFYLACDAIALVAVLAAGVTNIAKVIKKNGDPARNVAISAPIAFALLFVAYILDIAYVGILINTNSLFNSTINTSNMVIRSLDRLGPIDNMFFILGNCALLVTLSEASGGLSLIVNGAAMRRHRIVVGVLAVLSALCAFVGCMLGQAYYTAWFTAEDTPGNRYYFGAAAMTQQAAANILLFVSLVALILGAIYSFAVAAAVDRRARKAGQLDTARKAIIIVSSIFFAIRLWSIVRTVLVFEVAPTSLSWYVVLDALFDNLGDALVFCGIFAVAGMRDGGLWSSAQDAPAQEAVEMREATAPHDVGTAV